MRDGIGYRQIKLLGDPLLFAGELEEIASSRASYNSRNEIVMMSDDFFHRPRITFFLTTSFLVFFFFLFWLLFFHRSFTFARRFCMSFWLISVLGSQVNLPVFEVIGSHPEGLAAYRANVGLLARVQCRMNLMGNKENVNI